VGRIINRVQINTDASAAHEDDNERLKPAGCTDDPDQTNKQQHSEDVLNAREIDSKHGSQLKTTQYDMTVLLNLTQCRRITDSKAENRLISHADINKKK